MPYGAFVEMLPGRDGLVHISELSEDPAIRVARVEDVVNLGDEIKVMVTEVRRTESQPFPPRRDYRRSSRAKTRA